MWVVVFYSAIVVAWICFLLSQVRSPRWYWGVAAAMWVASFLGAFSIGLYLLVVAVVALALATGHSLGRIKRWHHSAVAILLGTAVWAVLVLSSRWSYALSWPETWAFHWGMISVSN